MLSPSLPVLRHANLRLVERASPADLQRVGVHAERGDESLQHHGPPLRRTRPVAPPSDRARPRRRCLRARLLLPARQRAT